MLYYVILDRYIGGFHMLSFLQSDSFPENTFFLLSYLNEDCIKPFYFSESGARMLKVPPDKMSMQNIATTMNQSLKKYIKDATLSNGPICCSISDPTPTENEVRIWIIHLYAFKQNDSYLILCSGLMTQNKHGHMVGGIPKEIFENLIISNQNHILFGLELNSQFDLVLACYGSSIYFLMDSPPLPNHEDKIRLDSLLTTSNYCIIKSHALQCLNDNGNHSFVYYQESANQKKYYSIRMVSDLNSNPKMIYGTAIDITDYINSQQNICLLHENVLKLFESFNQAACTVHVKDEKPPVIETQTKKFSELQKLNPEFPFHLLTSQMRDHLLLNNSPINLKKKLQMADKSMLEFDITITPFYRESQSTLLIISALPTSPFLTVNHQIINVLTPREQQIIKFVLNGEKNIVIACHLNITEGTVKKIISNAYKKLRVTSRTELIKQYLITM